MPNIVGVLKAEITRLARKEIRTETHLLKKASAQYRRDIAEMKRRLADLQRRLGPLQKQVLKAAPAPALSSKSNGARFTAKGLRSQRQRLGLSAADYGKLVGVTGQTIYAWEHETARPRRQQVAHLAALRRLGKRDAQARLAQLKPAARRKSK